MLGRGVSRLKSCSTPFLGVKSLMKKSDMKYFTVAVSLEAVSKWCGLAPSVVLAYAREFGIKIIDETDGDCNGEVTFEVYLDFVLQAGLPIKET